MSINKHEKECYYCNEMFVVGKSLKGDHVIPDALGVDITFKNVCPSCNTKLNAELDKYLIKAYAFQAATLGIRPKKRKGAYNLIPFNKFSALKIRDNLKADFTSNGISIKEQRVEDCNGQKVLVVPNRKIRENKLKAGKKLPFDDIIELSDEFGIGIGNVEIDWEIMLRAFSKVCINFVGYQNGIEYLNNMNLDGLKKFIVEGNNPEFKIKFLRKEKDDEKYYKKYHHSIIIMKKNKNLIGLISIFGDYNKILLDDEFNNEFETISFFDRYYR